VSETAVLDKRMAAIEQIRKTNPGLAARMEADPTLAKKLAEAEKKKRAQWPCKDAVPNTGQERAFACLKEPHPTYNDYPHVLCLTGGNGSGKTSGMAMTLLPGVCYGKKMLNAQWFGNHKFFDEIEELRKTKRVAIRVVCDKDDATDTGSLYQQVKMWMPLAEFTDKEGKHYTRIKVPNPDPDVYKDVTIDIKTHGQPITAHAGPDIDILIFNEPAPMEVYNENMSRLRRGGRAFLFLTPLYLASYLWGVIHGDHPDGEVVHVEISIWDNCTENRGILTREAIERQIRDWEATKPLEVPARRDGKFSFLAGAVFPMFNESVHVLPEPPVLRSNWNCYQSVDPHPVKPHVSLWGALDASNCLRIIAEYPYEPWENLARSHLGIAQYGDEFERIERGNHPRFPLGSPVHILDWVGDPNAMACRATGSSHPTATIADDYDEKTGRRFNLSSPDSVQLRHERITELLYYDRERPLSSTNHPMLYISPLCRNLKSALGRYMFRNQNDQGTGMGLSDKVEAQWECWIAALGYMLLTIPQWSPVGEAGYGGDYEEYLDGGRSRGRRRGSLQCLNEY